MVGYFVGAAVAGAALQIVEYGKFLLQQISLVLKIVQYPSGTRGPVVQLSAFMGLAHHGQFTPRVHVVQGFSHPPEATVQSPF